MTGWGSLLVVLSMMLSGVSGCLAPYSPESPSAPAVSPAPSVAVPLSLQINASPPRYNLAMSSTIGIRLEPVNTSGFLPDDARFVWETSYGSFYHWGPPDFKVTELGPRYIGTGAPVYWSYFSLDRDRERPPVNITLAVLGPSMGEVIARSSIRIVWENPQDPRTAVVAGSG